MTAKKNRKSRSRKAIMRRFVLTMTLMLVAVVVSIGGTIAWLTDETPDVVNTFSPSNIDIWMTETVNGQLQSTQNENTISKNDLKMVPGSVLDKDPKVWLEGGSEDCYVFLKVTEGINLENFISYDVNPANWKEYHAADGVYYCEAKDITSDRGISVIGYYAKENDPESFVKDKVFVNTGVTKADMDGLHPQASEEADRYPTLTFKAAAVQMANIADVDEAYKQVKEFLAE